MLKLTQVEKSELETQLKKAREASARNRLCVILGHDEGLTINQLAKAFRLSHATICNYLKDYTDEKKTQNDARGGSQSKLNQAQSQELIKALSETTYLKTVQICAYVKEKYGITYSRSGMTAWLKDQGFVYKRPKKGKHPTKCILFQGY